MQRIEDVVNNVIVKLREYGLKESSIQQLCWSVYHRIISYHLENGAAHYSDELLEQLCQEQKSRHEKGEISRKFYRAFVTAAFRIRSYVNVGEVDFSVVKDTKRYNPREEYERLTSQILESTGFKNNHQKKLSTAIRHFFCFVEGRHNNTSEIIDKDFIDFIPEAAKTNKNNMSAVVYALRLTAEYLNDNCIALIKTDLTVFRPASAPRRIILPYTQTEISAVLNVADSNSKTPSRNRAIILLAFNSGLRCVDIRNLKLSDINWEKQELHIVQTKTNRPISVPLNGKTLNAIADYVLQERPKCNDTNVFIRGHAPYTAIKSTSPLDAMINKYCRLASVEKKSYRAFHSLRRAFGTELAKAEVPVTSISQLLGHSDMSSAKAYLSFNRKQTALCSADFTEIPIAKGIYARILTPSGRKSGEGGDVV